MVIDFHTHCYPDKVAEKAIAAVGVHGLHASFDATLGGLARSMIEAGIDYSVNLPLANSPENTRGVNSWAAKNNSGPIFSLGSIHPEDNDPAATLKWIRSLGLKGIKMHPEYQRFDFADLRLDPIWKACISENLFVITHGGMDIAFEPPPLSTPAGMADFHRRFPELELIVAHLGGMGMWDEVEKHLVGLPVYLDLAMIYGYLDGDKTVEIIRRHGSERILFGTDAPWASQKEALTWVRGLGLTEEELANVLYRNAAKLLGIDSH